METDNKPGTDHKVVIITGAAGGIGLATANKFASQKAIVILVDLNEEALNKAAEEVKKTGAAEAWPYVCDVSKESMVATAFKDVLDRYGKVDVVINNAGRDDL